MNFFLFSLIMFRTYRSSHFSSPLWYASNDYDRFPFQQYLISLNLFTTFSVDLQWYFRDIPPLLRYYYYYRDIENAPCNFWGNEKIRINGSILFVLLLFDRLLLRFPEFWISISKSSYYTFRLFLRSLAFVSFFSSRCLLASTRVDPRIFHS